MAEDWLPKIYRCRTCGVRETASRIIYCCVEHGACCRECTSIAFYNHTVMWGPPEDDALISQIFREAKYK